MIRLKKQLGFFEKELIVLEFHLGGCSPFRFFDYLDDVLLCQLEQKGVDPQAFRTAFRDDGLHGAGGVCLQVGEDSFTVLLLVVHCFIIQ